MTVSLHLLVIIGSISRGTQSDYKPRWIDSEFTRVRFHQCPMGLRFYPQIYICMIYTGCLENNVKSFV